MCFGWWFSSYFCPAEAFIKNPTLPLRGSGVLIISFIKMKSAIIKMGFDKRILLNAVCRKPLVINELCCDFLLFPVGSCLRNIKKGFDNSDYLPPFQFLVSDFTF